MTPDPYATLGISRDATPAAIKRAYKKLARESHPDLHPGKPEAEAQFKRVASAHALLIDPARRARFDAGEIDADGQEVPPPSDYRHHADSEGAARYAPDFSDLFADMFEAREAGAAAPRKGADRSYRLEIAFLTAIRGAVETMTLPGGRTLSVTIPPGVEAGQVLRLRGQGSPGQRGGGAGDALIVLDVAGHPDFSRVGDNIHLVLPVSLGEAVLGGPVTVPTPFGPLKVILPAGRDSDSRIRLRGKGVPAHGARQAGDMILILRVHVGSPDPALAAFLRQWVPEHPDDPRAALEVST